MKTVFVTGGSSPLGQRVLSRIAGKAGLVVLVHKRPVEIPGTALRCITGSLEQIEQHAEAIRSADVILHLAAVTHADDPARYDALNTQATARLARLARAGQRFVFVSTICAHPEAGDYGVSKLRAEEAVRAGAAGWTIIRPAEIYGSKSGEGIDALFALARKFRTVPDFRTGGSVRYAPISLDEAADFIAAATLEARAGNHLYTLASEPVTARDIARAAGATPVPFPVALLRAAVALHLPVPFKRDQIARMTAPKDYDATSARRDHGFTPRPFLDHVRGGFQ